MCSSTFLILKKLRRSDKCRAVRRSFLSLLLVAFNDCCVWRSWDCYGVCTWECIKAMCPQCAVGAWLPIPRPFFFESELCCTMSILVSAFLCVFQEAFPLSDSLYYILAPLLASLHFSRSLSHILMEKSEVPLEKKIMSFFSLSSCATNMKCCSMSVGSKQSSDKPAVLCHSGHIIVAFPIKIWKVFSLLQKNLNLKSGWQLCLGICQHTLRANVRAAFESTL